MTGIRDVAVESGITPAFFTATAWGGAVVPDCMIPMWGGYAYRPWMLFEDGTHPKTDEFVYQNFHKDGIESTYDFHPSYRPETRPYGCCEIGSGMMVGYRYRFQYPCKSVDAVANIKMASGCNFLGYYMFHGGSHPHGKDGTYMNDGSLPKISYDYQAPIGEYGQVRESFRRVKNIHYFAQTFQEKLCCMQTVLPEKASEIRPEDETTLRYAVRTDGKSGFLFVNNFQDHLQMPDKTDQRIRLICGKEELVFPITIAGSDNAILPFHLDIDGIDLVMGTAQPLTVLRGNDGINIHVFFVHEKMEGGFLFEKNAFVRETGKNFFSWDSERQAQEFYVEKGEVKARILVLSQKMAEQMYIVKKSGLIFTQGVILDDGETIRLESSQNENLIFTFPEEMKLALPEYKDGKQEGLPVSMNAYVALCDRKECAAVLKHTDECRYILELPDGCLDNVKDVVLKIDYIGDIGNAFIGSRLISDNYANQQTWEIGLSDFKREIRKEKMVFYISPLKKGVKLIIDNQMAAVREKILDIRLEPIYEIILKKKREFPGFVLQQKFSR